MSDIHQCGASAQGGAGSPLCSNGKFDFYRASDLHGLPDVSWLIEGILPRHGVASLYGPSGDGKSFLALDMSASIGSGLPWFDFATRQGRVIYVALEGQVAFRRRVQAWARYRQLEFPESVIFQFKPFALNKPEDPHSLGGLINTCGGADLIVIDTLNKAAPGADENSSSDMSEILAGASALQALTEAMVLLVHHPGKDLSRGLRGHSSLHAALDAVIEVGRDGNRRWWRISKSKDGLDSIGSAFDLKVVDLGMTDSGKPITSCAVVEVDGPVAREAQREPRGTNQKVLLTSFKQLLRDMQMLGAATGDDWPTSIPIDEAISRLFGDLNVADPRHRKERAREAFLGLVKHGYLELKDGVLSLPHDGATPDDGNL
ncbi:MAG: helicase RepA family protein [Gallionellaceae bacterium]|nr:helicase RepA family protein [Gallionellaceae bacterium]